MTLKKQGVLPATDGGDESAPSSSSSISSPRSIGRDVQKRPRPPALWNVNECKLWLERHCGDIGVQYADLFHQNNVNGRALLKVNELSLERMGITDPEHKEKIWREIIKLKLKSDVLELRDLESQLPAKK